ncbi:MAG: cobalamin-dependent protein [Halieaceae bacterium]|jgi:methylmalonyl-CoA mutase C-terminal domain/subunit|uniref:Cobalamin-binding protein n=1 Tax=Haliea salexigens TaxID=287487 RepID=A0A3C1KML4_9GAMM|nr:cobalamin-dependent protein [Haliea alexandrii]MAA87027.1 cobalamin-binding protein [Haliea sp.]MCR9185832.1 cobalamin-dependent protein [Halieaceae bacterium]HAN27962.1 cobalamin-binding protein [Haliea salexigens]HAN67248.1 cobalamin-binding protein [Halieaceae bacterium]|tara:strand:- start:21903 stop:22289 length:387 start_codon:yes stop_codon:yes gene_type:complete
MNTAGKRILMAKTGLDGHWRGPTVVAKALRDAGFEVIMIGMARPEEVMQASIDEDVDLVGLNIGGHVDVAVRAIGMVRESRPEVPIFVGGVVPPHAKRKLEGLGVEVYPPGSQLPDIVAAAIRLTGAA